ncbi:MAG: HDIG domain-containing metalloprotein [Dehalococcoidia bacterium]|jgi:putative nucleotidyltransferase with HDIG domain
MFSQAGTASRTASSRAKSLSRFGALLFGAALAALLTLALFPVFPRQLQVQEGDIASRTWQAPRTFSFESTVLTDKQRDQAAAAVPDVLVFNSDAAKAELGKLETLISEVGKVRDSGDLTRSQKLSALNGTDNFSAPDFGSFILDMPAADWQNVSAQARTVLGQMLGGTVNRGQENSLVDQIPQHLDSSLSSEEAAVVDSMVKPFIVASDLQVDQSKTDEQKKAARAAVVPVRVSYAKDQTIVASGGTIDSTAIEAMREAGLLSQRLEWRSVAAVLILSCVSGGTLGAYVYAFKPANSGELRRLLLLLAVTALGALAAKLYLPLVMPDHSRHFLAYALPLAAIPMLIAVLVEAQLAVVVAAVLAVLVTFVMVYLPDVSAAVTSSPLDALRAAAVYGFGGVAGALAVHKAERLNRFVLAGMLVGAVSLAVLMAVWMLDTDRKVLDIAWIALISAVSGLSSGILAAGAFVSLGFLFGITTRVQLMELAQLNQPLLRRLQDEAPGTFHHSIIVGNLAERAADLIGADSLLVRVGCYYHDIGKLRQPGYYIENQMTGANPHDEIDAQTSAQIISRHVPDGEDLARDHGLPTQVRDFIEQHHGTGRANYFYRKALEADDNVDPALFSYPGPKPQSREAAIVMLADSVEATIRSSPSRSPDEIDARVDEVVTERIAEGQLDESDLTLREIKVISESFKSTLKGVYHPRLEYPAPGEAEISKTRRRRPRAATSSPPALPLDDDGGAR